MKKIIASATLLISLIAQAQVKEGKIIYERIMQLPTRMVNMDPAIAAQMPKARTDQYELLFGNNQSLLQYLPNINNEDQTTFTGGGGAVVLRFAGGNDIVFHNFTNQTKTEQREVFDRSFLVTDSIRKLNWKLTEESKTILNYKAQKATATRIGTRPRMTMENGQMKREDFPDTAKIIVWFTTDIPVPAGPDFQGQLPGTILEVDIDNGQTVYKAIEISNKISLNKIKEPKDGKKVTAAEFTIERDKLMEEMRKNMPNGSIRIQQ